MAERIIYTTAEQEDAIKALGGDEAFNSAAQDLLNATVARVKQIRMEKLEEILAEKEKLSPDDFVAALKDALR